MLAEASITADRLRTAARHLQQQDLSALGESGPALAEALSAQTRPHLDGARAEQAAADGIDVNPRLWSLLQQVRHRDPLGDDRDLLMALLDDVSGRTPRLLHECGADPDDLRTATLQWRDNAPRPGSPLAARDPAGESALTGDLPPAAADAVWVTADLTHTTDLPADQMWALLRDPAQQPLWDHTVHSVRATGDGTQQLTSTTPGHPLHQVQVTDEASRQVTWTRGRVAHAPDTVLRLAATPHLSGTVLHLQQAIAVRGSWRSPLLRALAQRLVRARLRRYAQTIYRVASH